MPSEFLIDYTLPPELIAQHPLRNRVDARLMIVDRASQTLDHAHIRDLPEFLSSGDRVVVNDTKVLPAQLIGRRVGTGGAWQGLYLGSTPDGHWRIVCKTRGKLKAGDAVMLEDREGRPSEKLWLLERSDDGQWLAHPENDEHAEKILLRIGRVPLPHYIRDGRMVDADLTDYQTVFARHAGAVAAPTAGLHLTKELLRRMAEQRIDVSTITLHVGLGTFRPITAPTIAEHQMHAEWCEVCPSAAADINATRTAGGRIVAVGTTSVRTLESAAQGGAMAPFSGETNLYIYPPYEFRAVDGLLTNFHFPRTTLLVLVATLGGVELMQRAYDEALRQKYRFYSYGDAMLIL
jgi:S-adenosylmethionine:tRNA ribosyltransferase-isomerase